MIIDIISILLPVILFGILTYHLSSERTDLQEINDMLKELLEKHK
jgi:hypothetical protein